MYTTDPAVTALISFIFIWVPTAFLFGIISGMFGSHKGQGSTGFLLGLLLGPFGLLMILASKGNRIECKSCRQPRNRGASVCHWCGSSQDSPVGIRNHIACPRCAEAIPVTSRVCPKCNCPL